MEPAAEELDADGVDGALLETTGEVGEAAGAELGAGGAAAVAPAGSVVGTVDGWSAVFHVAVVGYNVVATAGEVVP